MVGGLTASPAQAAKAHRPASPAQAASHTGPLSDVVRFPGHAFDPEEAEVVLWEEDARWGWEPVDWAEPRRDGSYAFTKLPAGTYRIQADSYVGKKVVHRGTDPTFTPTPDLRGAKLSVRVTATLEGFATTTSKASKAVTVGEGKLITSTPTIDGRAAVGDTLTAVPGTWGPSDPTAPALRYQWLSEGKTIKGATKATYVVPSGQLGKRLSVKVTGALPGYRTTSVTSDRTAKVAQGVMTPGAVEIEGDLAVGATLTAKPGTWTPSTTTFSYQRFRGESKIAAARKAIYRVVAADQDATLRVEVSAKASGWRTTTASAARGWSVPQ